MLCASVALVAAACGKHTVPFKREGSGSTQGTPDAGLGAAPAKGESYPARTQRIEIAGRPLAVDSGAVRAALQLGPARADAKASVLLLSQSDDGALALERRQAGDDQSWQDPERVALLIDATKERCEVEQARVDALAVTSIAVAADVRCSGPATDAAAADPSKSASTPSVEHRIWAIDVGSPARILERITTLPGTQPGATLAVVLEQRDLDGDGHPDLLLRLDAASAGADAPINLELKLFERAGGMIREGAEPEHTLRQLADAAVAAHGKRDPNTAALARAVLQLHADLCRGPGAPRLLVGGRPIECGPSLGAGRAASVLTAELARQDKLAEALATSRSLQQPFYQLAEVDSVRAQQALRARSESGNLSWREAITVDIGRAPPARRSVLGFIDDGHVLVRGATPRSYDLAANRADPIGIPAGLTLVDPSGRLAIANVKRSCEGYHLAIVRASQILAGVVAGPSLAEPLFARAPAPAGARCPELAPDQKRDQGGYRVIEWTSAGVLIARDQSLLLLAVDDSGNATNVATTLAPSDPVPALAQSGELTPDGHSHVWLSPDGIAIHDRTHDSTRFLSAPSGTGSMTDIALSPSGRVLALLRGRQLFIGVPDTAPAQPAR